MVFIVSGVVIVTALVSVLRGLRGRDDAHLGWMSEQWVAEHRAMHPS
jgi:hypothetical protein